MRVLVAGATGTIGVPLVRALVARGHRVHGLTRDPANRRLLTGLGAEPVVADALDRGALLAAVQGRAADAVIHQLTALKKPPARHRDMAQTNALRTVGTANLLAAAAAVGARRFVTQSMVFGYGYGDHGQEPITEDDPFGPPGRGRFTQHLAALRSAEDQTWSAAGIDGVALRYGLCYGPGRAIQGLVEPLRRRRVPIPPEGGGVMSWVYIDDAAAATVAALERDRAAQAYNVVDDEPVRWGDFVGALARAINAATTDGTRLVARPGSVRGRDHDQHAAGRQRQGQSRPRLGADRPDLPGRHRPHRQEPYRAVPPAPMIVRRHLEPRPSRARTQPEMRPTR
jgi:nucleoside-diphosphate-sugar epimerase